MTTPTPFRHILPILSEALMNGRRVRMTVNGTSMLPWIKGGDIVELDAVNAAEVRVGDVLLGKRPDGVYVLHRAIGIHGGHVLLRGDAQSGRPDFIRRDDLIAHAVALQRGDNVIHLNKGPMKFLGLMWIISSPVGCLLQDLLVSARRKTIQLLTHLKSNPNI